MGGLTAPEVCFGLEQPLSSLYAVKLLPPQKLYSFEKSKEISILILV